MFEKEKVFSSKALSVDMPLASFTLAEILIVFSIIGILVVAAFPVYRRIVARAKDQEAQNMLVLIGGAEEVIMEGETSYVSCTDFADCNTQLELSQAIPSFEFGWDYRVFTYAGGTQFCAQAATNSNPPQRAWHYNETDNFPSGCDCSGADCPP